MVKKKEIKPEMKNSSVSDEKPSSSQKIKWWIEVIAAGLAIASIIFGLGYWMAGIEHKVEIMNLNQKHNNEMYELRMQMNNQIQSIQNKYDILESNYNALKERKEDNHGK